MKKFLSIVILITGLSVAGREKYYNNSISIGQENMEIEGFNLHTKSNSKYRFSYDMSFSNNLRNTSQNYNYISYGLEDFHNAFRDYPQVEVLSCYELYKYPNFREYARILPEYNDFMKQLHEKIITDKKFRDETFRVQGFASSFGWRSQKSGFHDFVAQEVRAIEQLELLSKAQVLKYQVQSLSSDWLCKQKNVGSNFDYNKRLDNRIQAAEKFMKGDTLALNNQLRSEVSEIEHRVTTLERNYSHDRYVKVLTPLVRACAAQAIAETFPIAAFRLTDFSYVVTDVLFQGMDVLYTASRAVVKGAAKGVTTVASIEHWKNMVTDTVQLAGMCLDIIVEDEIRNAEYAAARFSQDSHAIMKFAEKHCLENPGEREAFRVAATESYNRLKAMSWQELLENGSEIGTTMILDTFVLNFVGASLGRVNNAVINKISSLSEGGVVLTEQYVAEVAGFGKLIIEEGPKVSQQALEIIKNNESFFLKGGLSEVICENIASKINSGYELLIKSASDIVSGNNTAAGRAFQKHTVRPNSAFVGEITGNAIKNTEQAMTYINKILKSPEASFMIRYKEPFGEILDVRLPDGLGARWSADGKKFIGFLEKRN